jgi:hypothetical protein
MLKLSYTIPLVILLPASLKVSAQVTLDGTLGQRGALPGPNYQIGADTRLSSFLPFLWSAIRIIAHERHGAIILIALQRHGAIILIALQRLEES